MSQLFLSNDTLDTIAKLLGTAEKSNGKDVYSYSAGSSWDCKRWDCTISCDCSNCRD